MMNKRILLMAGGTGGHIFPALAVGHALEQEGWSLHWLGSVGGMEQELVPQHGIPMTLLPVKGVRNKGLVSLIKAPFQLLNSIILARKAIKQFKPDVVLGMGGFASGPGGIAAKLCGVPLVIHEQNAIAGMTNNQLNRFSRWTLQAYPGTFAESNKVQTVGNPVRQDIGSDKDPALRIESDEKSVHILVIGGSRGAAVFNEELPETFSRVNSGLKVQVRHQCGKGNHDAVLERYQRNDSSKVIVEVSEFISDMARAYEWADLVVCRAGALTVAEIAMAGCVAIFVPYPHAVDDHQTYNARYLADQGAALIIQQHDLSKERLAQEITALANDKEHLIDMARKAQALARPEATQKVAEYCKKAAEEKAAKTAREQV